MSLSLKKTLFKKLLTLTTYLSAWLSVCRHGHILIILTWPIFVSRSLPLCANVWENNTSSSNCKAILHLDFPRSLTDKICIHHDLPFYAFQHNEFLFHFMLTHVSYETKSQCICNCLINANHFCAYVFTELWRCRSFISQQQSWSCRILNITSMRPHSLSFSLPNEVSGWSHVARELYSTVSKWEI